MPANLRGDLSSWAAAAGLVLAVAASAWLAFDPGFYQGVSTSVSSSGAVTTIAESSTLIEQNGVWILGLLGVPVALAGFGLYCAVRRHRVLLWVSGLVLIGFVAVSGFTIGLFYAPAALALLVASGLCRGRGAT
jgi:glucan phosphoethanolaminetransferase (alkaline phosphatase superfamily)